MQKPEYIKLESGEVPDKIFERLLTLDWLTVTEARKEFFMADESIVYNYSNRDYTAMPFVEEVKTFMTTMNAAMKTDYNVCFLNRYDSYKNQLGWHSDDSPEMDLNHPIAVWSLGQERQIWWKHKDQKGDIPAEQKVNLEHNSLFIMPVGFQIDHFHKIPKHHSQDCGVRISMTFRRYI